MKALAIEQKYVNGVRNNVRKETLCSQQCHGR